MSKLILTILILTTYSIRAGDPGHSLNLILGLLKACDSGSSGEVRLSSSQLLEKYYHRKQHQLGLHSLDVKVLTEDLTQLGMGFDLKIYENGFDIINNNVQSSPQILRSRKFKNIREAIERGIIKSSNPILIPATLLRTSENSFLLSIYEADYNAINIYGIRLNNVDVELEYIFRVGLFGDGLSSPPYLGFGPSIIYTGIDNKLHAYVFFNTSSDVERVFKSKSPLSSDLRGANFNENGKIDFLEGDKVQSTPFIFTAEEYWKNYLNRF